jgi:hypothetical protein
MVLIYYIVKLTILNISFSFNLIKILDDNVLLKAYIYSCDDFVINDNDEKLYDIDILFSGEDSVIDYFISSKLAIKKVS